MNASGITWLGGLTAFEVSNPSLRKQSYLAKFVTLWSQAVVANATETTLASGSNPGGRAK